MTAAGTIGTTPRARFEPDIFLFQVLHHAGTRVETVRAAAGENDRVHSFDEVCRVEEVGFPGSGRAAALRDAADGAIRIGENDGASRQTAR
jgi:hypothetical protein